MEIDRMNYYFTGILIILMCLLALFVKPAYSGSTQTNTTGSNTAIEGGYTGGATTYESGSTSTTTSNNTSSSNIKSAPPTASAPSYNSMTQDVCSTGASMGVQTFGLGISGGKHFIDENCERLKLARTPCPIDGKIGNDALVLWNKYNHERPDFKTYVKRMKKREKINAKIQKEITQDMNKIDIETIKPK